MAEELSSGCNTHGVPGVPKSGDEQEATVSSGQGPGELVGVSKC